MGKFIFFSVFFSLMSFFLANAKAVKADSELGSSLILLCYGENLPAEDLVNPSDVYSETALAGGAYNAWCYNAGGDRVAMIHHDAPFPVFFGASGFYVSFTHYKDRNGDGVLVASEADGYIKMFVAATPALFTRSLTSPDFTQAVVASEIQLEDGPDCEAKGICEAMGWFKDTTQALNRNNVRLIPICANGEPTCPLEQMLGARADFINFGVMSFKKTPVPIVQ